MLEEGRALLRKDHLGVTVSRDSFHDYSWCAVVDMGSI